MPYTTLFRSINPLTVRNEISRAKDELATPYEYAERSEGYFQETSAQIYHRYQRLLANANGVDFGDMVAFCVRLFREIPEVRSYHQDRFRFILVDEYQDTNRAQYMFVRELAAAHGNLCVVGDDDQSIRSEEHTSELQSLVNLVCRLLLEKKKKQK